MAFLKKYFFWFILAIALLLVGYVYSIKKAPCEVPIEYTLGSFDTRFNTSKTDFLSALSEATHVWENAIGKNLFEYAPSKKPLTGFQKFLYDYLGKYFTRGPIIVSLIYDVRQKNADVNRTLTSQIDESKLSADAIKQQFVALQSEYNKVRGEYLVLLAEYKARRGDFDTLEAKRLEVNRLAAEVNALISKYNYLVGQVNSTVDTINLSAGQEFEEGQYVSDVKGERINIYEFGTRAILVRVLAHEFGHVLGIDHNSNPNSVMYYLNSSKNIAPTKEDISALKAICAPK